MSTPPYHLIGIPGNQPDEETPATWRTTPGLKPDYQKDIVQRILSLQAQFTVSRYGVLSIDPERYPLYYLKNKHWQNNHPIIFITAGVHGQDSGSISGALSFMETQAVKYTKYFNLLCIPCISPWSYEAVSPTNPYDYDPDRHFYIASPCEESSHVLQLMRTYASRVMAHFDLQESTQATGHPKQPGFSLLTDTENPQYPFQKAITASVHQLLMGGSDAVSADTDGITLKAMKALRCCGGLTNGYYRTTTKVYPEALSLERCEDLQVAAITGGLDFILKHRQ